MLGLLKYLLGRNGDEERESASRELTEAVNEHVAAAQEAQQAERRGDRAFIELRLAAKALAAVARGRTNGSA